MHVDGFGGSIVFMFACGEHFMAFVCLCVCDLAQPSGPSHPYTYMHLWNYKHLIANSPQLSNPTTNSANGISVFVLLTLHVHTESQEQLRRAIPKYANLDQRPPFTYAALIRQVGTLLSLLSPLINDTLIIILMSDCVVYIAINLNY